jgi:predicted membrane metal-binding protein
MGNLNLADPWEQVAFAAVGKWLETKKELDLADEQRRLNDDDRQSHSAGRHGLTGGKDAP